MAAETGTLGLDTGLLGFRNVVLNLSPPRALALAAVSTFLAVFLANFLWPSRFPTVKGPKGVFLLGNLPEFLKKGPLEALTEWSREFGGMYKCFLGVKEVLVVSDPELVKEVTVKRFKSFRNRPAPPELGKSILMGIVWGRNKYWSTTRNAVLPMFHNSEHLESYVSLMQQCLDQLSTELSALPEGQVIDMHQRLQRVAMDIICTTTMGGSLESDGEIEAAKVAQLIDEQFKSASVPTLTTLLSFFLPDWATSLVMQLRAATPFTEERVRAQRATTQQKVGVRLFESRLKEAHASGAGQGRPDVLTQLVRAQAKASKDQVVLTNKQIAYLLGEFVLVGTDTTANVISFAVFLLATHPQVEAKVVAEIQALSKAYPPTSIANLEKYTYTSMVVKEVLRLYPTGGQMFRQASEDTTVGGVRVPKGAGVLIMTMMLHRNPNNFHDPETFIPERFDSSNLEEASRNNMGAYVPFGAGPRTCLGYKLALQEAALAIIHLHKNYKFTMTGECAGLQGKDAIAAMKIETVLVTKPANGIPVTVSKRHA